jgi:hypothetical protein
MNIESLTTMAKRDNYLMKLMKLGEIRHVICHSDKGDFCLMLSKDGQAKDYRFVLDAVPVDNKTNKELLELFNGVLFNL